MNVHQIAQITQVVAALNNPQSERGAPWRRAGYRRGPPPASKANNATTTDADEALDKATINGIANRSHYEREVVQNNYLKDILDSAAHPAHINHTVPAMQKLETPLTTNTATSTSNSATHQGTLRTTKDRGVNLELPAVIHTDICTNFVSVNQLARRH